MNKAYLDCRGMACPQPVVETKKKLTDMTEGLLEVSVDNETAKNNLMKLASSLGVEAASREEKGVFIVSLLKGQMPHAKGVPTRGKKLLVTADTLGRGSDELGGILIKAFFYALAESERLPDDVYLLNSGVKLACEGSPVLESLQKLAGLGVGIHACGLCLDFFNLKEQHSAGEITNMYTIVERLMGTDIVKL